MLKVIGAICKYNFSIRSTNSKNGFYVIQNLNKNIIVGCGKLEDIFTTVYEYYALKIHRCL